VTAETAFLWLKRLWHFKGLKEYLHSGQSVKQYVLVNTNLTYGTFKVTVRVRTRFTFILFFFFVIFLLSLVFPFFL
jgi:hypothetical protein